eukprot:PhM_4_TR5061/c0_g2_i1/m.96872
MIMMIIIIIQQQLFLTPDAKRMLLSALFPQLALLANNRTAQDVAVAGIVADADVDATAAEEGTTNVVPLESRNPFRAFLFTTTTEGNNSPNNNNNNDDHNDERKDLDNGQRLVSQWNSLLHQVVYRPPGGGYQDMHTPSPRPPVQHHHHHHNHGSSSISGSSKSSICEGEIDVRRVNLHDNDNDDNAVDVTAASGQKQ